MRPTSNNSCSSTFSSSSFIFPRSLFRSDLSSSRLFWRFALLLRFSLLLLLLENIAHKPFSTLFLDVSYLAISWLLLDPSLDLKYLIQYFDLGSAQPQFCWTILPELSKFPFLGFSLIPHDFPVEQTYLTLP